MEGDREGREENVYPGQHNPKHAAGCTYTVCSPGFPLEITSKRRVKMSGGLDEALNTFPSIRTPVLPNDRVSLSLL